MNPIALRVVVATAVAAAILAAACGSAPAAPSDAPETTSPSSETPSAQVVTDTPANSSQPTAGPGADQAYVPERSIDTEEKRLNVTLNGETVYIRNGSQVFLGDGLAVEIFVDPYPPSTLRTWVDLYLTRDGEPVTDASMGIEYDMLAMVHGPFSGVAEKLGGGHYLFTLDYIMFGPWDQAVTIRIGLERIRFPIVLVAYP